LAVLAVAAALLLGGCGNGEDEVADTVGDEVAVAAEPAPAGSAAAAPPVEPPPEAEPAAADEPRPPDPAPAAVPEPAADEPPPEWDGQLPAFTDPGAALGAEMAALIGAADPDRGRSYAQRCTGCHSFLAEGPPFGGPEQGPILFGVAGKRIGAAQGFDYSPVFVAMHDARAVWTDAALDAFLADPERAAPGTLMDAGRIPDPEDRANVIAYLKTLQSETGVVGGDPELLARIGAADPAEGEMLVTARCAGCHRFTDDVAHRNGPHLYRLVGAPIGGAAEFN
jgi:cytochrome c2